MEKNPRRQEQDLINESTISISRLRDWNNRKEQIDINEQRLNIVRAKEEKIEAVQEKQKLHEEKG